jgi:glycosyltransferase involved in cell wall biosynthesis
MHSTEKEDFQLSIIIPAYSEKQSLIHNVKCALERNYKYILEVIIIVSAFADEETLNICKQLSETEEKVIYHIQENPPGLGYALREGFSLARGTHIQILYADCESDPDMICYFIQKARQTNADMVVGSRWLVKGNAYNYPNLRYFFNQAYQNLFRILFLTRLHDLTFGFNLLKTEVVRNIIWHGKKHELVTEMVLKVIKFNYNVEEIPVTWKRRNEGKSVLKITNYLYYPFMALFILICPKKYLFHNSKTSNRRK